MSGARPVIAPPPPVIVRYAPATNMRGPGKSPCAIASRIATSTKARYVPTSRTVVNPASSVAFALGIDSKARSAALFFRSESGSESFDVVADEMRVAVDQAGQDRQRREVDHLRARRDRDRRPDRLDPAVLDEDDRVGRDGAGPRVDEPAGAHRRSRPMAPPRPPGAMPRGTSRGRRVAPARRG